MFVVLYRWRIKPELEKEFIEGWSEVTEYFVENSASLGSRLHRGADGVFYAYAQWKSAEQREKAFSEIPNLPGREKMRRAIDETFPEIRLDVMSDYLKG